MFGSTPFVDGRGAAEADFLAAMRDFFVGGGRGAAPTTIFLFFVGVVFGGMEGEGDATSLDLVLGQDC